MHDLVVVVVAMLQQLLVILFDAGMVDSTIVRIGNMLPCVHCCSIALGGEKKGVRLNAKEKRNVLLKLNIEDPFYFFGWYTAGKMHFHCLPCPDF